MGCAICHRPFVPGIRSLSPAIFHRYEEEEFDIHNMCGREFEQKQEECTSQVDKIEFVNKLLKQISM